jgi:hypothetical protein
MAGSRVLVTDRPERALWSTVSVRFAVVSLLDFFTIAGFAVPFALSSYSLVIPVVC